MGMEKLPGIRRVIGESDIDPSGLGGGVMQNQFFIFRHEASGFVKTGRIPNVPVDASGWVSRTATFGTPFSRRMDLILHSISRTNPIPPSGLKLSVYPSALGLSGIRFWFDVNVSCSTSGAVADLDWLSRGR